MFPQSKKDRSTPRSGVQRSVLKHPLVGDIILNKTPRAKRISISVHPSGEVRLTLPLRGSEAMAMQFLESRVEWIEEARRKVKSRAEEREKNTPKKSPITRDEMELLLAKAMEYLPRRIAELANHFGFKYGGLTVTSARSRWGSCSSKNNISLSLFLMQLPPHLIDFVIIHELCHTIHHNHSPQFHAEVNRCTNGRERELHNELRRFGSPS